MFMQNSVGTGGKSVKVCSTSGAWGGLRGAVPGFLRLSTVFPGLPGAPLHAVAAVWRDTCGTGDWGLLAGLYTGTSASA